MPGLGAPNRSGNRLLDALPEGERGRLTSAMRRVPLQPRQLLHRMGEALHTAYFPVSGLVSLVTRLTDGRTIEAAAVGNEGMVGVEAVLSGDQLPNTQAMAQVAGEALAIEAGALRAEVERNPWFRRLLLAYLQALLGQVSQAVACNGVHEVHQRAARWLLETHDRVGRDTFELTHEFLAEMLGVTRPSVTIAARTLQAAGLIRYTRGTVTILDRGGLEEASCECYQAIRRIHDQVLGQLREE
ncbi:MAG TPA: Crp/Fnr family transcriptional regulator [Actinomycetota bacterium]|nr:Crp/Fnr family transcriptional regulator [Actinomycetota bacterium]